MPEADARPVVMKFGGSSVADLDRISDVASYVVSRAKDQPVVVVVSAMGKSTDRLVSDARRMAAEPPPRELDMLLTTGERHSMAMLALAIHGAGHRAISLTGSQCGIITDHRHGDARIVEVRPFRILDELHAGHVVIVGGFQGVSYKREVTTLGRGGSDTTAVALAAALEADCEIYSDVDGVYSSDPRIVADAQQLPEIGTAQMRALSRAGARVLHAQAVAHAEAHGVRLYARATKDRGEGKQTVIHTQAEAPSGVVAVALDREIVSVRIATKLQSAQVLETVAALGELGLRSLHVDGHGVRGFVSQTTRDDAEAALSALEAWASDRDAQAQTVPRALVSCVGAMLEDRATLFATAASVLADAGVVVHGTSTDSVTIAFEVDREHGETANRALHGRFVG